MGQNAEVIPGPLSRYIAIYSLEACTIFSIFFKKHMLGFARIISVFRMGWRFTRVGTRYPEHAAVRRSVNGGLMLVYFSVTPGVAVSMREN